MLPYWLCLRGRGAWATRRRTAMTWPTPWGGSSSRKWWEEGRSAPGRSTFRPANQNRRCVSSSRRCSGAPVDPCGGPLQQSFLAVNDHQNKQTNKQITRDARDARDATRPQTGHCSAASTFLRDSHRNRVGSAQGSRQSIEIWTTTTYASLLNNHNNKFISSGFLDWNRIIVAVIVVVVAVVEDSPDCWWFPDILTGLFESILLVLHDFQDFSRIFLGFSRIFQRFYKDFQGFFKDFTRTFQGFFQNFSRIFKDFFGIFSRIFPEFFQDFQGFFRDFSKNFPEFSRIYQGFFQDFSGLFKDFIFQRKTLEIGKKVRLQNH